MNHKHRIATASLAFVVAVALGGCAVTTTVDVPRPQLSASASVGTPRTASPQATAVHVNRTLALTLLSGSTIEKHQEDGRKSKTEFRSSASLDRVYGHTHAQLTAAGWQRTRYEVKRSEKVEARYTRAGETLKVELNRQGNSGRYKLEIS